MKVKSYKYIVPNSEGVIPTLDRNGYMTSQYINEVLPYISSINIEGSCAFLYAAGVSLSAAEARNSEDTGKYRESVNEGGLVIKELTAYAMHKWIGAIPQNDKITYANINSNTCASSMYSLYEAEQLLNNGIVDEVIIVAEEKTSHNTLKIFDQHKIDLKVGEALAIVHLVKGEGEISTTKWAYEYNRNPFGTTQDGYKKVDSECDMVNPHGTGTSNNEEAELVITEKKPQVRYKEGTGHTQGVSGLLEVCMILDDSRACGNILCVSAGLGGFFGSCIVHKG